MGLGWVFNLTIIDSDACFRERLAGKRQSTEINVNEDSVPQKSRKLGLISHGLNLSSSDDLRLTFVW